MHEIFKRLSLANHSFGHWGHAVPTTGCRPRVFFYSLPKPMPSSLPPIFSLSPHGSSLLPPGSGAENGRWRMRLAVEGRSGEQQAAAGLLREDEVSRRMEAGRRVGWRRAGGGERGGGRLAGGAAGAGSGKGCARRRAALRFSPRSVPSHSLSFLRRSDPA